MKSKKKEFIIIKKEIDNNLKKNQDEVISLDKKIKNQDRVVNTREKDLKKELDTLEKIEKLNHNENEVEKQKDIVEKTRDKLSDENNKKNKLIEDKNNLIEKIQSDEKQRDIIANIKDIYNELENIVLFFDDIIKNFNNNKADINFTTIDEKNNKIKQLRDSFNKLNNSYNQIENKDTNLNKIYGTIFNKVNKLFSNASDIYNNLKEKFNSYNNLKKEVKIQIGKINLLIDNFEKKINEWIEEKNNIKEDKNDEYLEYIQLYRNADNDYKYLLKLYDDKFNIFNEYNECFKRVRKIYDDAIKTINDINKKISDHNKSLDEARKTEEAEPGEAKKEYGYTRFNELVSDSHKTFADDYNEIEKYVSNIINDYKKITNDSTIDDLYSFRDKIYTLLITEIFKIYNVMYELISYLDDPANIQDLSREMNVSFDAIDKLRNDLISKYLEPSNELIKKIIHFDEKSINYTNIIYTDSNLRIEMHGILSDVLDRIYEKENSINNDKISFIFYTPANIWVAVENYFLKAFTDIITEYLEFLYNGIKNDDSYKENGIFTKSFLDDLVNRKKTIEDTIQEKDKNYLIKIILENFVYKKWHPDIINIKPKEVTIDELQEAILNIENGFLLGSSDVYNLEYNYNTYYHSYINQYMNYIRDEVENLNKDQEYIFQYFDIIKEVTSHLQNSLPAITGSIYKFSTENVKQVIRINNIYGKNTIKINPSSSYQKN